MTASANSTLAKHFFGYFLPATLATIGLSAFTVLCVGMMIGLKYALLWVVPLAGFTCVMILCLALVDTIKFRRKMRLVEASEA